jgi:uncharacterized membrane protein
MTDTSQPRLSTGHEAEGKPAALIAWGLYILSIPSANVLVLVGLVVAYAARGSATGLARQHMDAQIALFWSVFWWTIALWVLIALSAVTIILIPLAIVFWLLWFLLSVWFTVKSVLGVINLLQDRPA